MELTFKSSILSSFRPRENSVFAFNHTDIVKLLTTILTNKIGFSHRNEHKFRHNFHDVINPLCSCVKKPETTLHHLLSYDLYSNY